MDKPPADREAPPRVESLVLNWNRTTDTLAAVASLLRSSPTVPAVTVIDNGSEEAELRKLRDGLPAGVALITNGDNLGFAEGNNVGIRRALERGVDYLFLLNSDAEVTETTVKGLVETLEADARAGVAGPTILTGDDPPRIESQGGIVNRANGRIRHHGFGRAWEPSPAGTSPRPVDMVSGCAFMVRSRSLDRVGLMDARFFCYLEETDWCLRLAAEGWSVLHVPTEVVRHKGGASLGGTASAVRVYFGVRNHLLLFNKNAAGDPFGRRTKRTAAILGAWLLFLFFSSGIRRGQGLKMFYRGLNDYRRRRFGGAMLA